MSFHDQVRTALRTISSRLSEISGLEEDDLRNPAKAIKRLRREWDEIMQQIDDLQDEADGIEDDIGILENGLDGLEGMEIVHERDRLLDEKRRLERFLRDHADTDEVAK